MKKPQQLLMERTFKILEQYVTEQPNVMRDSRDLLFDMYRIDPSHYTSRELYEIQKLEKVLVDSTDLRRSGYLFTKTSGLPLRTYYEVLTTHVFKELQFKARDESSKEKDEISKEQHQYPYIPLHSRDFADIIKYTGKTFGKRNSFIDVGCGIGDKTVLAFASGFFKKAYGIEYDLSSYLVASNTSYMMLMHMRDDYEPSYTPFIHGDAFQYDFNKHDTIYLFCPLSTSVMMGKLLSHVYESSKNGTVILFKNVNLDMENWEKEHSLEETMNHEANCNIILKE